MQINTQIQTQGGVASTLEFPTSHIRSLKKPQTTSTIAENLEMEDLRRFTMVKTKNTEKTSRFKLWIASHNVIIIKYYRYDSGRNYFLNGIQIRLLLL